MKRILSAVLLALAITGCNSWERNTFNTLSASKAVLDTAQSDYESKTIAQTTCAYSIINDGKAAQTAAVNALLTYEGLKASKGSLTAQEAVVTADLVALAPLVVQVQSLISNPAGACGGKQ
ncbi:MAG: hypothetical protein ACJ71S_06570 [Acidobacteriaceae bacterium]|jgi:PBP1b-binding outer membrane lipoprotein LpoB